MDTYEKQQRRARRRERKYHALGTPTPTCTICGWDDVRALLKVPVAGFPKSVLEGHHVAGKTADRTTVPVCLNHHAVLSDDQYDWDLHLRQPKLSLERLAAFLEGLANWLRLLGQTFLELATRLEAWVGEILKEVKRRGHRSAPISET